MTHQPVLPSVHPAKLIPLDLGFGHNRQVLRLDEVSSALAITPTIVRELVECGILVACAKHAGQRQRHHINIERWSVEAWRLNQWEDQGMETERIQQSDLVKMGRERLRKMERLQKGGTQ